MSIYLVVDETGLVANAVEWDGETVFEEPGCTLIPHSDTPEGVWIGWVLTDSGWRLPEATQVNSPVENI